MTGLPLAGDGYQSCTLHIQASSGYEEIDNNDTVTSSVSILDETALFLGNVTVIASRSSVVSR